ncbi:single-stranded DNA-binding protein [Allobranchiibius sp. GilTou38]|uniref:single-stranded DNA-binding protein n=1 Tax=Allobranchiibius sp. GilTou38 TaxID=2815210 RepID=UPI001AA0CEB8|nr:single-stranded DNA-binding protein [Allobranchiibius sp. GilTou38]MBO1766204.1 single-stranded DNA-binding protein [Allobranchiibius sp. GilTou38]
MAQAANEGPGAGSVLNDVQLIGRISAPAERRVMPSDDELVSFRLVVDRDRLGKPVTDRKRPTVDVIDVACWTARTRKVALALQPGDVVRVQGALRRRFWKAGGGAVSRHEVEAASVARVRGVGARR